MKNKSILTSILLIAFLAIPLVSSTTVSGLPEVRGRIFDTDTNKIGGATVTIVCEHLGTNYTQVTTSFTDATPTGPDQGWYNVTYPVSECSHFDNVTVYAVKGSLSGVNRDTMRVVVNESTDSKRDIATIHVWMSEPTVPVVPEFGLMVGALTILGAVGIFFIARK